MSEPRATTGKTEIRPCRLCTADDVVFAESVGLYGSGPRWTATAHNAPCGLPCFSAGARGRVGLDAYNAGQMHGLESPCPACGFVRPPTTTPEPEDPMGQHYSDPSRKDEPHALPDIETFYVKADAFDVKADTWMGERAREAVREDPGAALSELAGWYRWACFPGCLPDSEAEGPYETEALALVAGYDLEESP